MPSASYTSIEHYKGVLHRKITYQTENTGVVSFNDLQKFYNEEKVETPPTVAPLSYFYLTYLTKIMKN